MGLLTEHRKPVANVKGNPQVVKDKTITNVSTGGGQTRSSEEGFVMKLERRGLIIQFSTWKQLILGRGGFLRRKQNHCFIGLLTNRVMVV